MLEARTRLPASQSRQYLPAFCRLASSSRHIHDSYRQIIILPVRCLSELGSSTAFKDVEVHVCDGGRVSDEEKEVDKPTFLQSR